MAITLQEVLKTDTLEIQRQKFNQVALDIFNTLGGAAQLSVLDVGISDGTVGDPSLYFNNEVTLGIFRPYANSLSFAAGGEKPFSVKPAGGVFYKNLILGYEGIGQLTLSGSPTNLPAGTYILPVDGGSGSGAQVQFDVINYAFTINGGSGYVDGQYLNVSLDGGTGSGATANITVSGIVGTITTPGTGYGDTQFSSVTLTGGSGTGATADLVSSNDGISSVIITSSGQGYLQGDVLSYGSGGFQFTITSTPNQVTSVALTADDSYAIGDTLTADSADLGGLGQNFSISLTNKGFVDTNSIVILSEGIGYLIGDSVSSTNPLSFTVNFTVTGIGDLANITLTPAGQITTSGQITAPRMSLTQNLSVSTAAAGDVISLDGVLVKSNYISTTQTTDLELTTSNPNTKVVIKGRDFAVSDGTTELFSIDNTTGSVTIGGAGGGSGSGSGGISFGTLQIRDNTLENTAAGYNSFGSIVEIDQLSAGAGYYPKTHAGVSLISSASGYLGTANFTVSPWEAIVQGGSDYVDGSYFLVNLYEQTGVTRSFTVVNNGTSAYTITGTDKNGAVSGDNPSITCDAGDSLEFNVNANGHPFYIQSVTAPYSSSSVVPTVLNSGAELGTVRWEPPAPGTYTYVCGIHSAMNGTITVEPANTTGVQADVTISGNTVTSVFITSYGTGYTAGAALVAGYGELGGTLGALNPPPSGFEVTVGNEGVVTGVTIVNGGVDYANGEVITANIAPDYVETITNIIGGSGYAPGFYVNVPLNSAIAAGNIIQALTISSAGTGLTDGIYYGVSLTGGSGSNASADIEIFNGSISSVSLISGGTGYLVGDTLGTGFAGTSLTVSSLVPGAGGGLVVDITVDGTGSITTLDIVDPGTGYGVGDGLSVDVNFDSAGLGSNFSAEIGSTLSGVGWSAEVTQINGSGILIIPADDKLVKVKSTSGFVIPSGDGSERPLDAEVGCIRYNTQSDQYEGFNGTDFVSLGGVRDVDGNTYITAELTAGNDDNTLTFYNDGNNTINVTENYFDFHTLSELRKVDITEGINNEIATYWKAGKAVDPSASSGAIEYIYFEDRLYQVTVAGTLDAVSGPTHTTGAANNGTAELTFVRLVYDSFIMSFGSLDLETQNNLNITSNNITVNTNLSLKNGDTFYKNSGSLGFGLVTSNGDESFFKIEQANSIAKLVVNSDFGSGNTNDIVFTSSELKHIELLYTRNEINRITLVKGSSNLGVLNLYDVTLYSGARVYIVAENITTGEKESVEYSIIDNGINIYTTEYNQISTNPSVPLYTSEVAYNNTMVKMDITIGASVATAEQVVITISKVLIKK